MISTQTIMTSSRKQFNILAEQFCDIIGVGYKTNTGHAINVLITLAMADGWWDKCSAIYPFVGGTATTNKYNLKDPRDADAAYRLTFTGGWTHSINGSMPNGTTGYADTHFPANTINAKTSHLSYLSSTSSLVTQTPIGNSNYKMDAALAAGFLSGMSASVGAPDYDLFIDDIGTAGLFAITRDGNFDTKMYFAGSVVATGTQLVSGNTAEDIYIGARNTGGVAGNFSDLNFTCVTIGTTINDTDAANMYYACNLFSQIAKA